MIDPTTLYEQALESLRKSRAWSSLQADKLREYGRQVAAVESRGDPTAKQYGCGPGRGKYQFELAAHGGSGSNTVARTRLSRFTYRHGAYIRLSLDDEDVLRGDDPDFSELSEDAQDVLFLANADMHPKFKLHDLVNGLMPFEEAWIKYHWAGTTAQAPARRKHWREVNGLPA